MHMQLSIKFKLIFTKNHFLCIYSINKCKALRNGPNYVFTAGFRKEKVGGGVIVGGMGGGGVSASAVHVQVSASTGESKVRVSACECKCR